MCTEGVGEMRVCVTNGECPGGNKSPASELPKGRREAAKQSSGSEREATTKGGTLTAGRVSQREKKRNVCIV